MGRRTVKLRRRLADCSFQLCSTATKVVRCSTRRCFAEMGFDWFDTRYFSGAQGRFNSPDQPFAGQHPEDPQSWNLYAYALNNPLRFVDPNGRCTELLTRAARRAQA